MNSSTGRAQVAETPTSKWKVNCPRKSSCTTNKLALNCRKARLFTKTSQLKTWMLRRIVREQQEMLWFTTLKMRTFDTFVDSNQKIMICFHQEQRFLAVLALRRQCVVWGVVWITRISQTLIVHWDIKYAENWLLGFSFRIRVRV